MGAAAMTAPTSSTLGHLLAQLFPTLFVEPSPEPCCWVSKFARLDPQDPMIAGLSAALDAAARHDQLGRIAARLRDEHPTRRKHHDQHDERLISCLTEACAFAWADLRLPAAPEFDFAEGHPDVQVGPSTWVEAKSVNRSQADRALTRQLLKSGAVVSGHVPDIGAQVVDKFQYHYADALKKFARVGAQGAYVFFNLELDMLSLPWKDEQIALVVEWAERMVEANPTIGIVSAHQYDWQHPFVELLPTGCRVTGL